MAKIGGQAEREKEVPKTAEPVVPIPAVKMVPSVLERIEVVPVPRERWGGRPNAQRRNEAFEFTDERFSASRDGVAAATGFLFPANYDGRQIYGMEYKLKDEALLFTYTITGRNPGGVRTVIPGAEHTVVITENTAILVTGWAAWQRGEREIVVDGQPQRDAHAISFGLNPMFQGDSLLSAGASYKDGMTTIFMMNRYGLLSARGVSLASILYADIQFEPSEGWQLLSAGDVALLVKDGSANAYVLSADFSGEPRIDMHTIVMPEAVRGRAEIRRGDGAYTIVYNGGEAEITDSELHPQPAQE
ncbi:MAG: hypothetical protein WC350_03195 [Candidatus Micrarchaeia archaeon]|jgi:hypothetical protein